MQENLTSQERLERIASIINKGIYLLALKEGWFCHQKEEKLKRSEISKEERCIVELCKGRGKITNKDLQDLLGIHRNTATVKLKEMVLKRLLVQNGNRRHTYYVLNADRIFSTTNNNV
jgi:predicted HTH transcriptional regulator